MKVIGLDPSLTAFGIAAVDLSRMEIVDWECIRTKPSANHKKTPDTARRVLEIREGLRTFQNRHPGLTAIEAQVPSAMGKANAVSSFTKGLAYGVAIGMTEAKPVIVSPWEMRQRLDLTPNASKDELWDACQRHLTIRDGLAAPRAKPAIEAVHDAVAVALAARTEVEQLKALIGAF